MLRAMARLRKDNDLRGRQLPIECVPILDGNIMSLSPEIKRVEVAALLSFLRVPKRFKNRSPPDASATSRTAKDCGIGVSRSVVLIAIRSCDRFRFGFIVTYGRLIPTGETSHKKYDPYVLSFSVLRNSRARRNNSKCRLF